MGDTRQARPGQYHRARVAARTGRAEPVACPPLQSYPSSQYTLGGITERRALTTTDAPSRARECPPPISQAEPPQPLPAQAGLTMAGDHVGCTFCNVVSGKITSVIVFEDD